MKYILIFLITIASFAQTWTTIPSVGGGFIRSKLIKIDSSITFTIPGSQNFYTHNPINNTLPYKSFTLFPNIQGIYHYSESYFVNPPTPAGATSTGGASFDYAKMGNDTLFHCSGVGFKTFDNRFSVQFSRATNNAYNTYAPVSDYYHIDLPYYVNSNTILISDLNRVVELTYPNTETAYIISSGKTIPRQIFKVDNDYYTIIHKYPTDTTKTDSVYIYKSAGDYENFTLDKTLGCGIILSVNYNADSSAVYFIAESRDTSKADRGVWRIKCGLYTKHIDKRSGVFFTALSVSGSELLIATTNNVNTDDDKILQYDNKKLAGTFIIPSSVTQIIRNGEYVYIHYHRTTDLFPENTGVSTMPKFTTDISLPIKNYFLPLKTW